MSDHEKMPEPVEVWFWHFKDQPKHWRACDCDPEGNLTDRNTVCIGPRKIVPVMMSLDDLASHGLMIQPIEGGRSPWGVFNPETRLPGTYNTSIEAQWAATCLAKEAKP